MGTWTSSLPTATSIRRCVTAPRSASRTTSRIHSSGTTARDGCSAVLVPGVRRSSRGAALADLDSDGDSDLVVRNLDDVAEVLLGAPERPSVRLRLVGVQSNRDGLGARVEATTRDGRSLVRELRGTDGYLGTNEHRIVLGLGDLDSFEIIRVRWPAGGETVPRDARPGQILLREERE